MATSKITLIGLHNYSDGTIWNGLQLPEYFDRQTVIDNILLRCGEFEVLYASEEIMKSFISLWSMKSQRFFEHLAAAMEEEYLPLANYDRHEEWTDESTGHSEGTGTTKGATTGKVSAFNETGFQNRDQSITDDTMTSKTDATGRGDHTGHVYGNIGVMTTQKILMEEIAVSSISPYDIIADDFSNEFCIKIYV